MLSQLRTTHPLARRQTAAFTLLELLAVLATRGFLASLTLPALGRAQARASGLTCLSNLKATLARLAVQGGLPRPRPPNQAIWTNRVWRSTPDSWIGCSSAPHDTDTRAIEPGLLFQYDFNRSEAPYRCPADRSWVVSSNRLRTRSYSMNGSLGGRTDEVQNTVERADAIAEPAKLFRFIVEAEDASDDAHFLVWPNPDPSCLNLPAGHHAQHGILAFADAHAAQWAWQGPNTFSPRQSSWKKAKPQQDLKDLQRLQGATLPLERFTQALSLELVICAQDYRVLDPIGTIQP